MTDFETYKTQLVPRLAKEQPGKWIRIVTIAKDVKLFMDICQILVNSGELTDRRWPYVIIETKEDSLVRLDPDYLTEILLKGLKHEN